MHRLLAMVVVGISLGHPLTAEAHRLDEYLQATRLSIDVDRVSVEFDLTAGVNVAPQVLAAIDTNRDGQISGSEGTAYAGQVLGAVVMSVDGRRASLTLIDSRFPDASDMTAGVGTIRLRATASLPAAGSGRHQLVYLNDHRSEMGVYLVNAMVPPDPRTRITAQRRDPQQRRLTVDYDVAAQSRWARASWLLAGLAGIGLLALARRSFKTLNLLLFCRSVFTGVPVSYRD